MKNYNVLWSHSGMFLLSTQTISLNDKISNQKTGIVFILSRYEFNAVQDYGFITYFIPKYGLQLEDSPGFEIPCIKWNNDNNTQVLGSKYLYLNDDHITGAQSNGSSPNNGWVFRYVIGI